MNTTSKTYNVLCWPTEHNKNKQIIRITQTEKITIGEDTEKFRTLYTIGRNINMTATIESSFIKFSENLPIELSHDIAIPLLSLGPKRIQNRYSNQHMYTIDHSGSLHNNHNPNVH